MMPVLSSAEGPVLSLIEGRFTPFTISYEVPQRRAKRRVRRRGHRRTVAAKATCVIGSTASRRMHYTSPQLTPFHYPGVANGFLKNGEAVG
ncbi:protein of unknown function [Methylocaldum szegediense]|uniref:Uncharacterized protein n=1 Tax=Methylocaldum szegediense TaxID=73780 RepID=A0ABN8WX96_9GAMM|nr:protein of unknown function [Methylocaldum szegediense]